MIDLIRRLRSHPVRTLLLLLLATLLVRCLPEEGLTRSLLTLPLNLVAAFIEGVRSWEPDESLALVAT